MGLRTRIRLHQFLVSFELILVSLLEDEYLLNFDILTLEVVLDKDPCLSTHSNGNLKGRN